MARMFGVDVVVTLDGVHINHDTRRLVFRTGNEKDGREHVATYQGLIPEIEHTMTKDKDRGRKSDGTAHKEIVG